jgi:hypothetical protein
MQSQTQKIQNFNTEIKQQEFNEKYCSSIFILMGQGLYSYLDGTPPKANPGILVTEGVISGKTANRAMVHLTPGVRPHAESCMAVGWNLTIVLNNPLGAPGSTLLHSWL